MKTCTCCGRSYSRAEWEALQLLGEMGISSCRVQMRNCSCGGTMAVEIISAEMQARVDATFALALDRALSETAGVAS